MVKIYPRWWWLALVAGLVLLMATGQSALARTRAVQALLPAWEAVRYASLPPACPPAWQDTFSAVAFFERALAEHPQDSLLMLHVGRALWLTGACEQAQQWWERAAEAGQPEAWFELLTVGAQEAWPEDVAPALEQYAVWKGDAAGKAELPEAALIWYRRGFDAFPSRLSAQRVVGMLKGDQAAQLDIWDALTRRTADSNPDHWWGLAKSAELRQQWGVAAAAYERGAALTDKPYDFWMAAGAAWQRIKAWDQAEATYRAAADAVPTSTSPWLTLGHLFRAQKRWDDARAAYLQAQAIKPQEFYAPLYLGIMAYEMQDDPTARVYLLQALDLKPEQPSAAYYLAQVSYREGKVDEAEQWLTQAVSWNAAQKPAWWALQLGDWRLQLGRCASAREAYDTALAWGLEQKTYESRLAGWQEKCAGP